MPTLGLTLHMLRTVLAATAPIPLPTPPTPTPTPTLPATPADAFPAILLTLLLLAPVVAAVVVLFMPARSDGQRGQLRIAALFGSGTAFMLAIGGLNAQIAPGGGDTHTYEESHTWFNHFFIHANYHLTSDGMTLTLLMVSTLVCMVAGIASWGVTLRLKEYLILLLLAETGINGVLLSNDWFMFVMSWALAMVTLAMAARAHSGERALAAMRGFLSLHALVYLALIATGLLLIFKASQGSSDFDVTNTAAYCVPQPGSSATCNPGPFTDLGFWLTFVGFAATLAAVPLHRWYVEMISEAPVGVAVIVGSSLPLLGGYGLMRITDTAFSASARHYSLLVVAVGVCTAAWGAMAAYVQRDLLRVVAYSCVARNGVVLAALGTLSGLAMDGAVLALCANALGTAMLVVIAHVLRERTRTTALQRMSGLAERLPWLGSLWLVAVFSVAGVPFLAGFSADLAVLVGTYSTHRIAALALALCLLAGAGSTLWAMHRVLFGPPREEDHRLADVGTRDRFALLPLVAASLLFGVMPGRILPLIELGVTEVQRHLGAG